MRPTKDSVVEAAPARTALQCGRDAHGRRRDGEGASASPASPAPPGAEQRDEAVARRIRHAWRSLSQAGVLEGGKDARVTVRLHGALLDAARRRTGIESESALVSAGLALLAAGDDYGAWLVAQRGGLSDDFDLGI